MPTLELRQAIVAEARSWIGTPFRHLARRKGVGVDCLGLPVGIARAFAMPHQDMRAYPALPSSNLMLEMLERQLRRVPLGERRSPLEHAGPGDVVVFWYEQLTRLPQHVAVLTEYRRTWQMVHADRRPAHKKVCECEVDSFWLDRLVGVFSFPGVA